MTKRIASDQLPYATPPFGWEIINSRPTGKYRIRDAKDNAVGSADTLAEAEEIVSELREMLW